LMVMMSSEEQVQKLKDCLGIKDDLN